MMPQESTPTRLEKIAAGTYAIGTAYIYIDTIREEILMPLLAALMGKIRDKNDDTNETISTYVPYFLLLAPLVLLAKTQYSSNVKSISVYNQQQAEHTDRSNPINTESKSSKIATVSAVVKSAAAGISFWKLCKKIPYAGSVIGAMASVVAFSGSFFSQRKVLGLKPQTDAQNENTNQSRTDDKKIEVIVQAPLESSASINTDKPTSSITQPLLT